MTPSGSSEDSGPVRLGRLLPTVGVGDASIEAEVARVWPEVVGAEVARNSRPLSLKRGRLTVSTSSSAWAQTLQLLSRRVLDGVNGALGEGLVTEVVFRHAGWTAVGETDSAPRGTRRSPRRSLTPQEEDAVAEVVSLAGDEELGRRIAAAMRADLEGRPA
jgi:hypothetical protein